MEANTTNKNFRKLNKSKHNLFLFYVNDNKTTGQNDFIHDFLGQPTLPLLGKYSRESYDMSDVVSLITTTYHLDENSKELNSIKMSDEILDFINGLDVDKIDNKNKASSIIPTKFKSFKFYWVTMNNTFKKDFTKQYGIYNIVPHPFLFQNLDFSKSKRLVKNYPITIYIDKELEKTCGVDCFNEYNKNAKFNSNVNFNKLRVEYSSTHLIKEALGFSPNNLKFLMFNNFDVSHFYVIIIDENNLHVFYYWIINSNNSQAKINNIFAESENIADLIKNLESSFGSQLYLENLKKIIK